eukprot:scaffold3691_cov54-Isochrysis_galbana.AAC.1
MPLPPPPTRTPISHLEADGRPRFLLKHTMPAVPESAPCGVTGEDRDALHLPMPAALGPEVIDEGGLPGIAGGAGGRGLRGIPEGKEGGGPTARRRGPGRGGWRDTERGGGCTEKGHTPCLDGVRVFAWGGVGKGGGGGIKGGSTGGVSGSGESASGRVDGAEKREGDAPRAAPHFVCVTQSRHHHDP